MAEELVTRVTGQTSPDALPVALHPAMPATTLPAARHRRDEPTARRPHPPGRRDHAHRTPPRKP
ncbi:MAG: hypothetical protein M0Z51_13610 [Propionibacterium sp.]|nr:hypothetical protein [Propionibacterium sp.]